MTVTSSPLLAGVFFAPLGTSSSSSSSSSSSASSSSYSSFVPSSFTSSSSKREKERRCVLKFRERRRTFLCNCFPPPRTTRGKRRTAFALAMRREDEAKDARGRDFCETLDDDVLVETQDGLLGERDARLYARTRLEDLETGEKKKKKKKKKEHAFLHDALGITFRVVNKGEPLECDLDALNDVFISVNFSRRPNEKLYLALEKSYLCCFAEVDVEYETRALDVNNNSVESTVVETRREIIGFGRMTSDAAFVATVWDLVVAPPYQGKGIGTAIVERMIGKAKENAPGMVVNLCAVEDAVKMYKRIGFQRDEKEIIAMQFNPELQAMQHFRSVDFSI